METPYINRFNKHVLPKSNDKKPAIIGLILGTVLIAALFTQGAISDYIERSDAIATAEGKLASVTNDLTTLQDIETNLKKPEIAGDLKRYAASFREDDILENLFKNTSGVIIQTVSMDKGQKTVNGLSLANINLTVNATSKDQLVAFLDYLTSPESTKRYVIKSVEYPYDPTMPGGTATLSLGMYYYE